MTLKKIQNRIIVNNTPINVISKTIVVGSGKGGVGKSTVTANLAMEMAKQGKKVGLIDADIYGPTQPKMFGCEQIKARIENNKIVPLEAHGVKFISISALIDSSKPLILRAPIVTKLVHSLLNDITWGTLDYLLIDLPPGTGDIQLTISQNLKLDGAIIVTTPQEVSINIAQKGLEMFQRVNIPILGIVENMSGFQCEHCQEVSHIFTENNIGSFSKKYDIPVIAKVPLHRNISEAGDQGVPISELANKNIHQVFTYLVKNFDALLEGNTPFGLTPTLSEIRQGKLFLVWDKPETSITLDPFKLRLSCKCALCVNENTGESLIKEDEIPNNIIIINIEETGRYGLKVTFSDKHNTGIYTYKRLLNMSNN